MGDKHDGPRLLKYISCWPLDQGYNTARGYLVTRSSMLLEIVQETLRNAPDGVRGLLPRKKTKGLITERQNSSSLLSIEFVHPLAAAGPWVYPWELN
jgi:hypothetical protein